MSLNTYNILLGWGLKGTTASFFDSQRGAQQGLYPVADRYIQQK